ncbi:iron complex transport system permease protein [Allocatelliglobosispora scoriae]|uniref:Iron complex transport system permease protein n=1 Tax=Allocatelliglobosispora scoriae TaxID=643052 RepID=A0A841BM99_9ACTN|nr:iron chelate uptake ABC transporter family permease subunit [Allocatelliglobosispora scoriae]MBB5868319.1 iron complex transport system permease protein [Allocatelliglobosispora scoriae]
MTTVLRGRVLRSPHERVSMRVDPRSLAVLIVLIAATITLAAATLTTGDFPVPLADVVDSLLGRGRPGTDFIVLELRLPRLLTGLLIGAALGTSGAMFQRLAGNPLASPDLIGLTSGSATGAMVVILVVGGSATQTSIGSLIGAAATAALLYALAYRRGVQGYRFVLVGVGISAALQAVNSYLLTRTTFREAENAQRWLIGSLNGRDWDHVRAVGIAVAVLLPCALLLGRRLAMLEMGDDTARGLGVDVERTRVGVIAVSLALTAVATAAAGPIGFVALAAPQIATRLTRSSGPGLLPAAVLGGLLLVASDFAAQRAFAPTPFPVGIATGAIGGLYLIWLLAAEWRKRS